MHQKESIEKQKKALKKQQNDEEFLLTLPLKLSILAREEGDLKEKLERLEIEKNLHISISRLAAEEESAKYSKASTEHEAWPVLHNRYLLLSLLGKGGYSEVYKAYDLMDHIQIALKFHQLNSNWPEGFTSLFLLVAEFSTEGKFVGFSLFRGLFFLSGEEYVRSNSGN